MNTNISFNKRRFALADVRSAVIMTLLCVFSYACASDSDVAATFSIEIGERHPVLVDHKRKLVSHVGEKTVERIDVYPETGMGYRSHIFSIPNGFVFVDWNGTWYYLSRQGVLQKKEWKWMEELPKDYLYSFVYSDGKWVQKQLGAEQLSADLVYRIKDPAE